MVDMTLLYAAAAAGGVMVISILAFVYNMVSLKNADRKLQDELRARYHSKKMAEEKSPPVAVAPKPWEDRQSDAEGDSFGPDDPPPTNSGDDLIAAEGATGTFANPLFTREPTMRSKKPTTLSRGKLYPGSTSFRSIVSNPDWKVPDEDYRPVPYTSTKVANYPPWADAGIITVMREGLTWNDVDHSVNPPIDRRSFFGVYSVVEGVPRNPVGRTGISGRGCLGRWGPNQSVQPVITRWDTDKESLEYLVVVTMNGDTRFPQAFGLPNEALKDTSARALEHEAFSSVSPNQARTIEDSLVVEDVTYRNVDETDDRNTDNAWVEVTVVNFHQEDREVFTGIEMMANGDKIRSCSWIPYDLVGQMDEYVALRMKEIYDLRTGKTSSKELRRKSTRKGKGYDEKPLYIGTDAIQQRKRSSINETKTEPSPEKAAPPLPVRTKSQKKKDVSGEEERTRLPTMTMAISSAFGERRSSKQAQSLEAPATGSTSQLPAAIELSEDEKPTGEFDVEYLGAMPTTSPTGNDTVSEAVKKLKASKKASRPGKFVMGANGLEVKEPHGTDGKPPKTFLRIPIHRISFSGSDSVNRKIFALISNDAKTQTFACHAFKCNAKAKDVVAAVSKAFALAKEIKNDPFAINRDMPATEFAITDEFKDIQLPREHIEAKIVIGHGQYGKVFLAEHDEDSKLLPKEHNRLAVKLMRPDVNLSDASEFTMEAEIMKKFDHEHVLKLVGVCLEKKPWLIVVEFMQYKDLGIVLRQCKKNDVFIRTHEMLFFAEQVIHGLQYIHGKRYIHRDIAARNVLLTHNSVVKIGDFGLTRKLPDDLEYWKLDKAGRLPVKYMSVESLTIKRFSAASDVWAWAVYLWEIMAYGDTPYDKEKVPNIHIRKQLTEGLRLSKPDVVFADWEQGAGEDDRRDHFAKVWDKMFEICMSCWTAHPEDRPTLDQLLIQVHSLRESEESTLPDKRDIGLTCFHQLENKRRDSKGSGKKMQRGGSIIRAAKSIKRRKSSDSTGSSFRGTAIAEE